ncbi:hypothetical protein B0H17DRAFT_317295 [Mycena rosella]|uniref:Uncharacterized protein n=1 Tax=Mycena rosella TaxID=1033263 RepID=A0AAD7DVU1_MYCRO|nr:hypothetical protein B0H17DRAFT_317295 [Mycena rosella]
MPSSFPTESSGLGRKRKLADFDIEPLCAQFLNVLREEKIFAAIEQTEWNKMEKVLQESCNVPDLSKPFTEAKSYYRSLFEPKSSWIFLREDISPPAMPHPEEKGRQREPGKREAPPSDPYQEAAAKLKSNPLWKGVKAHIVMKNDASCRTAIDLVVLTAIDLAQSMISQNQELDRTLNDRFSIQGPKRRVADSGQAIAAWVVLQHEVEIPNQRLRPELSVHGILDYLLCVMPTSRDAYPSASFPRQ